MAPIAWAATVRSTRSRSGIRAWSSTMTSAGGTPIRTWARASSISTTATSTTASPRRPATLIAGSGTLQNAADVLTPSQRERLASRRAFDQPSPSSRTTRRAPLRRRAPDLALPRAERARRRVGRRARLPMGRGERERRARPGVLPDRQGGKGVGAGCRADGVDDQELLGALLQVSVPAGDVSRRTGGRHGVPDVRDGALRQPARRSQVDLRHAQSRARAPVVPDDRRLQRAALRVAGRGHQHLHQRVRATSGASRERARIPRISPTGAPPSRIASTRRS